MGWHEIVAAVLLALGALLTLTGGVGILRMPDFYARLHPAGKSDTLGQGLICVGLMFLVEWPGDWLVGAKLLIITVLLYITAPTATHAITRAAWLDGLKPFTSDDSADSHPSTRIPRQSAGASGSSESPEHTGEGAGEGTGEEDARG